MQLDAQRLARVIPGGMPLMAHSGAEREARVRVQGRGKHTRSEDLADARYQRPDEGLEIHRAVLL